MLVDSAIIINADSCTISRLEFPQKHEKHYIIPGCALHHFMHTSKVLILHIMTILDICIYFLIIQIQKCKFLFEKQHKHVAFKVGEKYCSQNSSAVGELILIV